MSKAEALKYGPQGKRLLGGLFANAFNVLARIGVQFVVIPILFISWDTRLVGIWLLLSSIPSYLGLTANGFGAAGGNLAIAAEKDGDSGLARAAFRATWLLVTLSNFVIVGGFLLASDWIISSNVFHTESVPRAELQAAMLWLCVYVVLSVQSAVLVLPYRHGGQYPRNIFLGSLQSTLEVLATAAVVAQTKRLDMLPLALSVVRFVFLVITAYYAWLASPGLFRRPPPGLTRKALNQIWRPSLAFMAAPVVFGFNLQGYNLLIGALFGPVVLASFVATRILVRGLDIITNFAYSVQFYELPYLQGQGGDLMRRLVATMTSAMVAISIGFIACVITLGGPVLHLWTVGKTSFDLPVALGLSVAGVVRAISISPAAALSATNRNTGFMTVYTIMSALSFGLGFLAGRLGAPLWVVVAMPILAELGQLVPAFRGTAHDLEYPLRRMARDIVDFPRRWADLNQLRKDLLK
ncbi:MAG: hypothetical protein RIS94_769 [Pseudomonadota bacterium]|jgi:O-antigen/teichoic acid export membrane protein